jgi:hypothetical protein
MRAIWRADRRVVRVSVRVKLRFLVPASLRANMSLKALYPLRTAEQALLK